MSIKETKKQKNIPLVNVGDVENDEQETEHSDKAEKERLGADEILRAVRWAELRPPDHVTGVIAAQVEVAVQVGSGQHQE